MHKKLHDNIREVTIPALDQELKQNDYSEESIHRFIGVFAGWLTGHILIEDRAITGKIRSKWKLSDNVECEDVLDSELKRFMSEISGMDVLLVNKHYEGLPINDAFYYEMDFENTKIVFVAQNAVILKIASDMIGTKQLVMNKTVMLAYVQLVHSIAKAVLFTTKPEETPILKSHRVISSDNLLIYFSDAFPSYSMEWKTPLGYMAICVM